MQDTNADAAGNLPAPQTPPNTRFSRQLYISVPRGTRSVSCLSHSKQNKRKKGKRNTNDEDEDIPASVAAVTQQVSVLRSFPCYRSKVPALSQTLCQVLFTHDPPTSILTTLCGRHYYFPALQMRNWTLGRSSHSLPWPHSGGQKNSYSGNAETRGHTTSH